jgi:plastocyanin
MSRLLLLVFVLVLVLAACGNSDATSTTTAPTSTSTTEQSTTTLTTAGATTTTAPPATTMTAAALPHIRVEDGAKTSGLDIISVRVGDTVRFEVEADIADELHVHGYDLTFDTIPDEAILVEFVADATGIFEVEIEGLGLSIVDIEVTP